MGGIVGIYRQGERVTKEELQEMMGRIRHRGADDGGIFLSSSRELGLGQLAILGPKKSRQPLQNEENTLHLIFNGEMYTATALGLEQESRGDPFQSQQEGELLLHLYEEEGASFLSRMRGMFSLALWDVQKKSLFLARDRFGIKPLYYYHQGETLLFASEIKALLTLKEVPCRVNMEALWHYLTLQYVPEPFTLFAGIKKLPPGHFLTFQGGRLGIESYWEVAFPQKYKKRDPDYYVQGVLKHLEEAVHLPLNNGSSVGAFLSGGIDSAILVTLLSRLKEDLKTFTVTFPHQDYNESLPAWRIAKAVGVSNYQVMVTPGEYMEYLPHLIWHMDEPIADPSAVSLYFAASLAKNFVPIVYSGEGADEIFAGYPIYGESRSLIPLRLLPSSILLAVKKLSLWLPPVKGKSYLYRASTPLLERYLGNAFIFSKRAKEDLLKKKTPFPDTAAFLSSRYSLSGEDPLTQMQYVDLVNWMPGDILMKADKMTMASSIELRVPFLDHHLFQFAAQIPPRYRLKGGESKYILRQVARTLLGKEIARHEKRGFPTPIRVWLKKEMRPLARDLFSSSSARRFFSPKVLQSLLKRHDRDEGDYSRQIWTIMVFVLWYEAYFSSWKGN